MSDRYGQLLASVVWVARRAGMGRDATSNLLSSAPETGRSSFASRKLPDAIECSRPVGDIRHRDGSASGSRLKPPPEPVAHEQHVGAEWLNANAGDEYPESVGVCAPSPHVGANVRGTRLQPTQMRARAGDVHRGHADDCVP